MSILCSQHTHYYNKRENLHKFTSRSAAAACMRIRNTEHASLCVCVWDFLDGFFFCAWHEYTENFWFLFANSFELSVSNKYSLRISFTFRVAACCYWYSSIYTHFCIFEVPAAVFNFNKFSVAMVTQTVRERERRFWCCEHWSILCVCVGFVRAQERLLELFMHIYKKIYLCMYTNVFL